MRPSAPSTRALELRALQALEAQAEGAALPPRTQFFAKLPGVAEGARWLGGQANAARGREVLWIVGPGAGKAKQAVGWAAVRRWLDDVAAHFDPPAPECEALALPVDGREIVLVAIRSARAPFTLRARSARPGEVPWFDARHGGVRSATRLDLIRLVTPLAELPQLEILEAELTFFRNSQARSRTTFRWTLDASIYLLPKGGERLIIPLHQTRADLTVGSWRGRAAEVHVTADRQSPSLRVTESALLADGLGRFFLYCAGSTEEETLAWEMPARCTAEFLPAGAELSALVQSELPRESVLEPNQVARWKSA